MSDTSLIEARKKHHLAADSRHAVAVMNDWFLSVKRWLVSCFPRSTPVLTETPDLAVIAPNEPVPKAVIKRVKRGESKENLCELLEHLDGTFEALRLPTMRSSWIERDTIVGLRKLGVHVPNPWRLEWDHDPKDICVEAGRKAPAMMSVTLTSKARPHGDGVAYAELMFAVKHKKLPWNVAPHPGIPYLFGAAFKSSGQLLWVHMWLTVEPATGRLTVCNELQTTSRVVRLKHPASRKSHGGKTATYTTRSWRNPSFYNEERDAATNEIAVKNLFRGLFNWWVRRDENWSVAVKKNGERMTFGIDRALTPTYFADRDKSVKTVDGKTKKIIHFVTEHERRTGDKTITVKQHVRGLREFDWHGYRCVVTAPKLTGRIASSEFDISPEYLSDAEAQSNGVEYMAASKVGKLLADLEDVDTRKRA